MSLPFQGIHITSIAVTIFLFVCAMYVTAPLITFWKITSEIPLRLTNLLSWLGFLSRTLPWPFASRLLKPFSSLPRPVAFLVRYLNRFYGKRNEMGTSSYQIHAWKMHKRIISWRPEEVRRNRENPTTR